MINEQQDCLNLQLDLFPLVVLRHALFCVFEILIACEFQLMYLCKFSFCWNTCLKILA